MQKNSPDSGYIKIGEDDLADSFGPTHKFGLDVLVGLSEQRKYISSKYLYDENGSQLFRKITQLPEYYPTNCEIEILEKQTDEITKIVGNQPFNLIELGAGFGRKALILLEHFMSRNLDFRYVPIDISESAMQGLSDSVKSRYPKVELNGLVSDYATGIKWLNNRYPRRNLVLFLGSSIGNFTHAEARSFLRNLWSCLNESDFLFIGFDLKKDIELLLDAYNDPQGVTRDFNHNVLLRINRELGGEFDVNKFRHFGTYDVFSGAMESYLVSLEPQDVFVREIGRSFNFASWEPIHTEYSYKYLVSDIELLAEETGFAVGSHLFDSKGYFADSIWRVVKDDHGHQ